MIELIRIDARLIHGQVAMTWLNEVKSKTILIVSEEAMKNEIAKAAIKMAKPRDYHIAIRDVSQGAELLNDERVKELPIFVIVQTVEETWRLLQLVHNVNHINIGGLISKDKTARMLGPGITVSANDLQLLKQMDDIVPEMEFRMVPSSPKKRLSDFE